MPTSGCDMESVWVSPPSMHHNLEWIKDLDIEYDASTFDTDPFEPQADGVGTIFPDYMWFGEKANSGMLECCLLSPYRCCQL